MFTGPTAPEPRCKKRVGGLLSQCQMCASRYVSNGSVLPAGTFNKSQGYV